MYYTITASAGSNGSISPSGAVSVAGASSQTFTITADPGYMIDQVLVDGVNNPAAVLSGTYTFSAVSADHTIAASFVVRPTYTITALAGGGGSISPSGAVPVLARNSQTFTITPISGYRIDQVLVDGVNDPGAVTSGSYTFTNVNADHTISASFVLIPIYTITASAGSNGSISPSGAVSVLEGNNQAFTITPISGYKRDQVLVDGVNDPGAVTSGSYTFSNVTANHTISASFVVIPTYTITASAGANGSIDPSGAVSVLEGNNQTFTITPDAGYNIDTVLVDGVDDTGSVSNGTYTFTSVSASHTIAVTFAARHPVELLGDTSFEDPLNPPPGTGYTVNWQGDTWGSPGTFITTDIRPAPQALTSSRVRTLCWTMGPTTCIGGPAWPPLLCWARL